MDVLLLCAGRGNRLKPITDKLPKPLIKISGKTILERMLGRLEEENVENIFIIDGYKKELIQKTAKSKFKKLNLVFITNPFYSTLNNIVSMWLAKPYLEGKEFVFINGDLVFDKDLLRLALSSKGDFWLIDTKKPLPEDSLKVRLKDGYVVDCGKKMKGGDGFTIGMGKFSKKGSRLFFMEIEKMIERGQDDFHYAAIPGLNRKHGHKHMAVPVKSAKYAEIDELPDIKKAEEIFK